MGSSCSSRTATWSRTGYAKQSDRYAYVQSEYPCTPCFIQCDSPQGAGLWLDANTNGVEVTDTSLSSKRTFGRQVDRLSILCLYVCNACSADNGGFGIYVERGMQVSIARNMIEGNGGDFETPRLLHAQIATHVRVRGIRGQDLGYSCTMSAQWTWTQTTSNQTALA